MGGTASLAPPSDSVSGSGGTPAQVAAIAAGCPTNQNFAVQNGPASKPVPADLAVSWVLRCTISHKGQTSVLVAERSQSDLSPLLRALRTPSAQRQKVVCPMMAVYLPYFELVLPDGKVFVPKVPVNNCNQPQNLVVQALESLRFAELTSRPLK